MYYLYHIPGKKIGVTRNLSKRVTRLLRSRVTPIFLPGMWYK